MTSRSNRRRSTRPKRHTARRILVVTEGKLTEPMYVEQLRAYLRSRGTTAEVHTASVGQDPAKVVDKCLELRDKASAKGKSYDKCVCLVDVDQHSNLAQTCKRASKEEILLLVSNLKFEVWLLWHATDKRSQLSSKELDRLVLKHNLVKNKSLSPGFPFDKVDEACDIAREADPNIEACRIGPDPSSAMPHLIELMKG